MQRTFTVEQLGEGGIDFHFGDWCRSYFVWCGHTLLLPSGCIVGVCGPVPVQLMHCGHQQQQCVTTTRISDDWDSFLFVSEMEIISPSPSYSLKKTSLLCKVNCNTKDLFITPNDNCACDVSLCILLEPVLCPFVLCSGGVLMMVDHLLCCWPVCTGASDSKQVWANIGSGSPQPGLSSSRVRFLFNFTWKQKALIPYYCNNLLGACCGDSVYSSLASFLFLCNQHVDALHISLLCTCMLCNSLT